MYKIIKSNRENGSRSHNNKCVTDDSSTSAARLLPLAAKTLTMDAGAETGFLINTKRNQKRSTAEAIDDLKAQTNRLTQLQAQTHLKKSGFEEKVGGGKVQTLLLFSISLPLKLLLQNESGSRCFPFSSLICYPSPST